MTGNAIVQVARYLDQGPHPACAVLGGRRGALYVRGVVRTAARGFRLPAARARLPHHHDRPHSGDGLCRAQRRQAVHRADRYAVRQRGEADGLGASRSAVVICRDRGQRGERIQADVIAADRDEFADPIWRCRTDTRIPRPAVRARGLSKPKIRTSSFRGASGASEPGISRFRVWSFGPSRNDG